MLGKIACSLGIHKWEKEPSHRELIKSLGINIIFWTLEIQKGVQRCTRAGCNCNRKVYRKGAVGAGGSEIHGWKRLGEKKEKEIDSLPVM